MLPRAHAIACALAALTVTTAAPAATLVYAGKLIDAVAPGRFNYEHFPWGCQYYLDSGRMIDPDGLDRLRPFDAIYFGAVGWPAKVPDHVSLWGSLVLFRREFDQYVNLRPVRLMPGVPSRFTNGALA